MAVFTAVTHEEMGDVTKAYGLSPLLSMAPTQEGTDNSNYILHTAEGQFIFTLFEGEDKQAIHQKLLKTLPFLSHLEKEGCTTPQFIPLLKEDLADESYVLSFKGMSCTLQTMFEGSEVKGTPDFDTLERATEALAKVHLATLHFEHAHETHHLHSKGYSLTLGEMFTLWRKRLSDIEQEELQPHHQALIAPLKTEADFLESRKSEFMAEDIARGYIHSDFFKDNALYDARSQKLHIIDFRLAFYENFVQDLATFLNAWCFTDDGQFLDLHFKKALEVYSQHRPLSDAEKHIFNLELRRSALRFCLSRLHGHVVCAKNNQAYAKKLPEHWFSRLEYHQSNKEFPLYGL